MEEVWKDIEGYNEDYKISNKGRVKSFKQYDNGKILSPYLGTTGYRKVRLTNNEGSKDLKVSRLVGLYFVDNPENKSQINHKNGDKTCDKYWNIEWSSCSENVQHAYDNGLIDLNTRRNNGITNGHAKLKERDVLEIRNAYKLGCFTQKEIAEAYNISNGQVSNIVNRKSWAHI